MKNPKTTEAVSKPKPDGVATLVTITRAALAYRGSDKPNLAEIGRLVGRAFQPAPGSGFG